MPNPAKPRVVVRRTPHVLHRSCKCAGFGTEAGATLQPFGQADNGLLARQCRVPLARPCDVHQAFIRQAIIPMGLISRLEPIAAWSQHPCFPPTFLRRPVLHRPLKNDKAVVRAMNVAAALTSAHLLQHFGGPVVGSPRCTPTCASDGRAGSTAVNTTSSNGAASIAAPAPRPEDAALTAIEAIKLAPAPAIKVRARLNDNKPPPKG